MLLQRWEAKIRRKESSPQPGIKLTATRSWVRHAHHWATLAGHDDVDLHVLRISLSIKCCVHVSSPLRDRNQTLTISQTSPGFYVSAVQVFLKTLWEKEKLLVTSNFSFSHCVFDPLKNFLLFSSNLKLSSAKSFSLEESKMCRLGKG